MTYTDEEILRKREEAKKEKYNNLEDGVYMDGRIIKFERKELLDTFSVSLPDNMKKMPDIYARVKYPSEFRPQVIITTLDLSVNMGFTVFPSEIPGSDTKALAERMRAAVHRSSPDYRMYPVEELEGAEGSWFAFRSHAMDSDLYNMSLAVSVAGKLVQGSFNCYYKEYQKWNNVALMIWESIKALEEEV